MGEAKRKMEEIVKAQRRPDFVLCLPGHPSSGAQEFNVINTILSLASQGKKFGIVHAEANNIYGVRNACLSSSLRRYQKPFEGKYDDYGYIVWIDQDNIVEPKQILRLLSHDVDMVGAWYRQYGGQGDLSDFNKSACGLWDRGDGYSTIRSYHVGEIQMLPRNEKGLVEVDYSGFGLMVMKKQVIEALEFPWFRSEVIYSKQDIIDPKTKEVIEKDVEMANITTDDEDFCHRVKAKGFKIFIDPMVHILHQKMVMV